MMRDGRGPGVAAARRWEFFQTPAGDWRWRIYEAPGLVVARSSDGFPAFLACVQDAEAHGFEASYVKRNDAAPIEFPSPRDP